MTRELSHEWPFSERSRGIVAVAWILIALTYCAMRVADFQVVHQIGRSSDTIVYVDLATRSVLTTGFWTGSRPPLVPLVYRALANDAESIAAFQLGLSILSWLFLAYETGIAVRPGSFRIAAFAAILAFSASTPIIVWDRVLLSEPISISLFAALAASALRTARTPTRTAAALLLAIAVTWGFARESNAWLLGVGGVLLLAAALAGAPRRPLVLAAVILIGVFALNDWLASPAHQAGSSTPAAATEPANWSARWVYPLLNVFAQRILPDPAAVAWFAGEGMPVTPALLRKAGGWASSGFYEDPELVEFRRWFAARARSAYVRYLLSRPAATIRDSWRMMHDLCTRPIATDATPADFAPLISGPAAEALYPVGWALLSWTAAVIAATLLGAARWRDEPRWLVPAGLILLSYPHAAIVWFADALEIGRHAVQMNVQLRTGMYLSVLFAVDSIIAMRAASSARRSATSPERSLESGPDAG